MPREHEYLPPKPGVARKAKHHATDDCEERLTSSGLCPSCGYNPDFEEVAVRWYCPRCNVQLDRTMQCTTCGHRYIKPQ